MKYDLAKQFDVEKAIQRLDRLIDQKATVNIEVHKERRTSQQNKYFHVAVSIVALELGYTLEECKTVLKRELGYVYEKNGAKFLKSTADMQTDELAAFTEQIRNWASTQGIYVPSPEEFLTGEAEAYIKNNKIYL